MAETARLAYLQARLQARHGERPAAEAWQLAEASVDLAHFLDVLRGLSLQRWVRAISADSSCPEIERALRLAWRDLVVQAADWVPREWRPAVLCLRWLPDLPAVEFARRGQPSLLWMGQDAWLSAVEELGEAGSGRAEALMGGPELSLLLAELGPNEDALEAWQRVWQRLLPDVAEDRPRAGLTDLLSLLREHRMQMARVDADASGQPLRQALGQELLRIFRRAAGTPAALFAFLGLEALELERVRANLVVRRLLRQVPEGRSWA